MPSAQGAGHDRWTRGGRDIDAELHLSADQIGDHGCATAIRHMDHVHAGHLLEQFARHVRGRTRAVGGERSLSRLGLGERDQFRDCLRRNGWVGHHHQRKIDKRRDRCDIAHQIERQRVVERRVDRRGGGEPHQRVAVGRRAGCRLNRHVRRATRSVLHYDRLSEPLLQPSRHDARDDVAATARREPDDPAQLPVGIGLRTRDVRHGREGSRAGSRAQEYSPRKCHGCPGMRTRGLLVPTSFVQWPKPTLGKGKREELGRQEDLCNPC